MSCPVVLQRKLAQRRLKGWVHSRFLGRGHSRLSGGGRIALSTAFGLEALWASENTFRSTCGGLAVLPEIHWEVESNRRVVLHNRGEHGAVLGAPRDRRGNGASSLEPILFRRTRWCWS
ncbi:hypothetical protein BASA82_000064 [Batrachochytrium salamandrivorans]|nr:hypothetical protein BASA81_000164 [Batrachochytrium salamandrivorans]KAH9262925.1 hypothetical protein BASA82_000064 [Batrachochytrium salamandrivorans]